MYSTIMKILLILIGLCLVVGFGSWFIVLQNHIQVGLQRLFNHVQAESFGDVENHKELLKQSRVMLSNKDQEVDMLKKQIRDLEMNYGVSLKQSRIELEQTYVMSQTKHPVIEYKALDAINQVRNVDIVKVIFHDVLQSVQSQQTVIFKQAIEDFLYLRQKKEVRCALPYLVIIKVVDMYDYDRMLAFIDAFNYFHQYFKSPQSHRILRNKFLSSKEKLQLIDQAINMIDFNSDFSEFLLYMLEHYNYKEFRLIRRNLLAVFNVRYNQGEVKVFVANERGEELFYHLWQYKTSYTITLEQDFSLLDGIVIRDGDMSVDYSYEELVRKYLNKQSKELRYGQNFAV